MDEKKGRLVTLLSFLHISPASPSEVTGYYLSDDETGERYVIEEAARAGRLRVPYYYEYPCPGCAGSRYADAQDGLCSSCRLERAQKDVDERALSFVVEVEAYQGEGSAISLEGAGTMPIQRMYCVGQFDEDGIMVLVDNGYQNLSELYQAWPVLNPLCPRCHKEGHSANYCSVGREG